MIAARNLLTMDTTAGAHLGVLGQQPPALLLVALSDGGRGRVLRGLVVRAALVLVHVHFAGDAVAVAAAVAGEDWVVGS